MLSGDSEVSEDRVPFERVDVARARELIEQGYAVVDVRDLNEFNRGHIPGARLLPLMSYLSHPEQLDGEGRYLFVCEVGERSAVAAEMACAEGKRDVVNLEGGTKAWREAGLPVER